MTRLTITPSKFREDDWATVLWKNYDNMLSRFHQIPERYGQTDRQTDGRTNGQNSCINIARQYADAR